EERVERARRLVGGIDLAGAQSLEQIVHREVEVHDLVRLLQEAVGNGLVDANADLALDDVLQALDVLHVERAHDVDSRGDDVLHVLVAPAVLRSGRVRVRDLVDQGDLRRARDHGVHVELVDGEAAVFDATARDDLQPRQQGGRRGAAVRLDEADDGVHAALDQLVGLLQHPIGLAHAGGESDVDLEPVPMISLRELETRIRGGGDLAHALLELAAWRAFRPTPSRAVRRGPEGEIGRSLLAAREGGEERNGFRLLAYRSRRPPGTPGGRTRGRPGPPARHRAGRAAT